MTATAIIGSADHFRPGANTNHFLGRCDVCDAHYVASMSLEVVEDYTGCGLISLDVRDAYRHVWATSTDRARVYDRWLAPPDGAAARLVEMIRMALKEREQVPQ